LNRLADPIKYRYNVDAKGASERSESENVHSNIGNQGAVMVKRGDDGALAISIDTDAIRRDPGGDGPIRIQVPSQRASAAIHEGTFLTGGNDTPVQEASSKVSSRLQQARRLDGNIGRQPAADRGRGSIANAHGSNIRSTSRTNIRDAVGRGTAGHQRQSARIETKPRIPKQSSFRSASEQKQDATGEPKKVVTYDSMGHALINGKPRAPSKRRGAARTTNTGARAASQKPASTFLTGAEDSDTSVEGRPKRKFLKRGTGNAISITPTGKLPRVSSVRKVVDPRVFAGIPAKPKRGAKSAAAGPTPAPATGATRVKSTSSISRVNLQRVDRDQGLQKSQSAQAISRARRKDDDSSVESRNSYSGKNVKYPKARGNLTTGRDASRDRARDRRDSRERARSDSQDGRTGSGGPRRGSGARDDSRSRDNDRSARYSSRGRNDQRGDSRERGSNSSSNARSSRANSRGRPDPRSDSRERGRNNGNSRGTQNDSRGRNDARSAEGSKPREGARAVDEKKQQNAFYEQITAKKKEELLNYLRGEMDEVNPNGSVTVLPPLQVLAGAQHHHNASEGFSSASFSGSLQKLQSLSGRPGDGDDEEGMLALLASHAKKLSDKIDRVDRKLEDYTRLKVPVPTTNRAPVSPVTIPAQQRSRRVSPEKLQPISPERQLLQSWAQYEEEEAVLARKIEDIKKLKQQIRESEAQSMDCPSPDRASVLASVQLMSEYDLEESALARKIQSVKELKKALESPKKMSQAQIDSPDRATMKLLDDYDVEEAALARKIEDIKKLKLAIDGPERRRQGQPSPNKANLKLWQKYDRDEAALCCKIDSIHQLRSEAKRALHRRSTPKVDLKIWHHADDEEAALTRKINEINAKREAEEALKIMLRSHEKPTSTRPADAQPDAAPLHLQLPSALSESRSLEEQTEAEHFASLINRNLNRPAYRSDSAGKPGDSSVDSIESILSTLDMQSEITNQVKKSNIGSIVEIIQGANQKTSAPIESPLKHAVQLSISTAGASSPMQKSKLKKVSPITLPGEVKSEVEKRAMHVAAMNQRHQTPPAENHDSDIEYDPLAADEMTFEIDNGSPDPFK
jgi:hypothetical protein